ncbi:hypothetical protein FGO68_gene3278 [Halteria grandinella]|uniref:Uncharacterized protein n=1 Tax=Halteria grandinella TaxID=5974 RepID=A0A8J8NC04_HALGN|nr:hypothetical protein FGO68_gene3278 [Halteria grandinella]
MPPLGRTMQRTQRRKTPWRSTRRCCSFKTTRSHASSTSSVRWTSTCATSSTDAAGSSGSDRGTRSS